MDDRRRLVRTPGHSGRAARAAGSDLRQDGGLATREPSGGGDARPPRAAKGTEQKRPRILTQDATGAKQQKLARA